MLSCYGGTLRTSSTCAHCVTRASLALIAAYEYLPHSCLAQFSCQLNSNLLFCALNTANKSTIADVRAHYARPESTAIPDEDSPLLPELAQFLETAGINHPFTKVRHATSPKTLVVCCCI
jgi:hypothetical protein